MAASKKKKKSSKKEMSEGQAIAASVFVIVLAVIAGYFAIKFILDFFFPSF